MNNTPMAYNHRTTIACPSAHTDAANQLALCLGESPADVNTFGTPGWQDAQGNTYSVCSFVCTEQWLIAATDTLPQRNGADLAKAQQAQDLLTRVTIDPETPQPIDPTAITYLVDQDPLPALAAMGLTRIEEPLNG